MPLLSITQLRKLAEEKLTLYRQFRDEGLSEQAAVSLISGAVVAVPSRPSREPDELGESKTESAEDFAAGSDQTEDAGDAMAD